jgi:shikimate 5-dehydrogenase
VLFRISWLVAVVCVVVGLGGCASAGSSADSASAKAGSAESVVVARAQKRWSELMAGELNRAYEFISPSGRLKLSAADYRLRINVTHIKKAVVTGAVCEAELCNVSVSLDYTIEGVPLSRVVPELWILDEGKWWFVYRG